MTQALGQTFSDLNQPTGAKSQKSNNVHLSKLEPIGGDSNGFTDNKVNLAAVSGIELNVSEMSDNSINASKVAYIKLSEAKFSDCEINGSSVDHFSHVLPCSASGKVGKMPPYTIIQS